MRTCFIYFIRKLCSKIKPLKRKSFFVSVIIRASFMNYSINYFRTVYVLNSKTIKYKNLRKKVLKIREKHIKIG